MYNAMCAGIISVLFSVGTSSVAMLTKRACKPTARGRGATLLPHKKNWNKVALLSPRALLAVVLFSCVG